MARRPILWALGVAASLGYFAWSSATELARLSPLVPETAPPSETPAVAGPASLTLTADSRGHFVAYPSVDNLEVRMLVDTGASFIALTDDDARALGVRPDRGAYTLRLSTANGVVQAARIRLRQVRLGAILVRDVDAVVMPAGALRTSLLGTSFLKRLAGYEVRAGRMILRG